MMISSLAIAGFIFGVPAVLYRFFNDAFTPLKYWLAIGGSTFICVLLLLGRRKYVWLLDEGIIKGFQLSRSRAFITSAVRFADVGGFVAEVGNPLLKETPYYIGVSSKSGWFRGVVFEPKSAKDMATTLEFLMLHIDCSLWDPEIDDWAYSFLRKHGKHLPRIV